MFVAIALVANVRNLVASEPANQIDAFATPTVVHFGAVLLLSITLSAPWPTIWLVRVALATFGAAGSAYMLVVWRRARRQKRYDPVLEDWLFHAVLPLVAYLSILIAGSALPFQVVPLLFVIGSATVLLLFVSVHNAWDTVTYVVVTRWDARSAREMESTTVASAQPDTESGKLDTRSFQR
jgi:hypothetical protein